MRRLSTYPARGEHNSLWYWSSVRFPLRVALNYLLMRLASVCPSLRLKAWIYRRMGMRIGSHVSVAFGVVVDIFFPELIEIDDEAIVGYGTTILAHEFLQHELRCGRVRIGKRALIGANCTILAGVEVADGCVVSACSLVNRDVEGFVGGVPAAPIEHD